MRLTDKELQFIKENINTPVCTLSLNKKRPAGIDYTICLNSIDGNQKMRKKVPLWATNHSLIYPYPLSLEQCSSQLTAEYKASLVSKFCSSTIPDKSSSFLVLLEWHSLLYNLALALALALATFYFCITICIYLKSTLLFLKQRHHSVL